MVTETAPSSPRKVDEIIYLVRKAISDIVIDRFGYPLDKSDILFYETKPEFEGDYTVVLFSLSKKLGKTPNSLGYELGTALMEGYPEVFARFIVIDWFLNLVITDELLTAFVSRQYANPDFGRRAPTGKRVMVGYWPSDFQLVLVHFKNMFLVKTIAEIYKANGDDVAETMFDDELGDLDVKEQVEEFLQKSILLKKADGSVSANLPDNGQGWEILRLADETKGILANQIAMVADKCSDYKPDLSVYINSEGVGLYLNTFKVVCGQLDLPFAEGIFHLGSGAVDLPDGQINTPNGDSADFDYVLDAMCQEAESKLVGQAKTDDFTARELRELYETIGIGGLKFFLLRVDPRKNIIFNLEETIDLHGFSATYIQCAYARIWGILRKMGEPAAEQGVLDLEPLERVLMLTLERYPTVIGQAALAMNPAFIAAYAFRVAQEFNAFYNRHSIAKSVTVEKKIQRLQMAKLTANVLKSAMGLLGIGMAERM